MITLKGADPKMIANNLVPFEPTHPGELIKDEIEFRKISQRKLSIQTGISYTLLSELLNGKRDVNTEYALLIEAALNIDAETLLRMQTRYNIQVVRKDKKLSNRLNIIRKASAML